MNYRPPSRFRLSPLTPAATAFFKLARWSGLAWEIELLGCMNFDDVSRGSLEIDSLGRPALSHMVAGELWYSVRNAP